SIPSSLGGCGSLSRLSLKGNFFQGQIPRFLERFLLEYLNLSYNDFEGEVPKLGVFANASAFSVLGNSGLCGGFVELGLPKCKETRKHRKKIPMFIILILISTTLVTITCFVYVWCKKKNKSQPTHSSTRDRFLKVSYNQLFKATNGFSKNNLIGNGGFSSVYKGMIDEDDDTFVAVKVLHLQNRGAESSFMREREAWRNIRHRNLLKIITSCSSIDFQGNDFKALPSNILLDDDMVAHVGDFGLARFLGTTSYQNSSTGIRGTIGYTAPEYGLGGDMTSNGDVYSFGILLLEVMTGKRPTDDIFNEGLSLHKFASMALPDHVMDVIDLNILNVYQGVCKPDAQKIEECLASTIKIGVSCSLDSPSQRMNMEKVVHELRHIQNTLPNV
ncbi:hypothetical protein M8C21_020342, partial [Ambrosia artemisiifolia]